MILAIATTVSYSIVLSLFGLPYSLLFAATGGALEFIPVLGPLAAALLVVGVAWLGGSGHVLWIVAFIAAYRVFQDYILNPFLMNKSVAVPALLVLFGLLAGEELAGIAGVFLATPLLAAALIMHATGRPGTGGPEPLLTQRKTRVAKRNRSQLMSSRGGCRVASHSPEDVVARQAGVACPGSRGSFI